MPRNKKKARKMKQGVVLEEALAAVREGNVPHLNGSKDLGVVDVADPFDGRRRAKVMALRNDPLGFMHNRRFIDDIQFKAGRAYQRDWEACEICGAKAINPEQAKVDGGRFIEPDTDRRLKAHAEMKRLRAALGRRDSELMHLVLALNIDLLQVAQFLGKTEHHAYRGLRQRFIEGLDIIASAKGDAPDRPARGPKRMRDYFDQLAKYMDDPLMHKAVRLSKET